MALALMSKPILNAKDRVALRWAAKKADEWFGSVTGDAALENHHLKMMDHVQDALFKLGIRIYKRNQVAYQGQTNRKTYRRV